MFPYQAYILGFVTYCMFVLRYGFDCGLILVQFILIAFQFGLTLLRLCLIVLQFSIICVLVGLAVFRICLGALRVSIVLLRGLAS